MAGSDQKQRRRIQRLDHEMRHHPRRHAVRIALYIAIGYLWPAFLLVACVIAAAAMFPALLLLWGKAGWEGAFIWVMLITGVSVAAQLLLLSLLQEDSVAWGMPITSDDAPELLRVIEQLREAMQSSKIHHVHLDYRINAAIIRSRRKGLFRKREQTLVIGVPLLAALTPSDLHAVIAHELGHLRGNTDPFGGWVYRVVDTWTALTRGSGKAGRILEPLLGWFARWYVPWITAATLPARREHEYRADEASLRAVGARQTGEALTRLQWASYRVGRTLHMAIWHECAQDELPPKDYMKRVMTLLDSPAEEAIVSDWRRVERQCSTHVWEQHPSLMERLRRLGAAEVLERAPFPGDCPADRALSLLGEAGEKAIRYANATWIASVIGAWRSQHAMARRLAKESQQSEDQPPESERASCRYAQLQADLRYRDPITARPLIAEFLATYPQHAEAHFDLGRILLCEDDDAGIASIERSIECSSDFAMPGLNLLLDHYRDAGRDAEADNILNRYRSFDKAVRAHRKHLSRIRRGERLLAHGITGRQLRQIQVNLVRFPQIARAYLVQRDSRIFQNRKIYAIAIVLTGFRRADRLLLDALERSLPLECTVLVLPRWNTRMRRQILAACPEPVFDEHQS